MSRAQGRCHRSIWTHLPAGAPEVVNPEPQAKGWSLRARAGSGFWVPGASPHSQSPSPGGRGCCPFGPAKVHTPASGSKTRSQEQQQLESAWHPALPLGRRRAAGWHLPPAEAQHWDHIHLLRRPHPVRPGARISAGSLHHPWPAVLWPSGLPGHLPCSCQAPGQGCCAHEGDHSALAPCGHALTSSPRLATRLHHTPVT